MSDKLIGTALVAIWSIARLVVWLSTRGRVVSQSDMPGPRRALLVVVSLSLVPIYLYYFTPVLDRFRLGWPAWISWLGNGLLALGVGLFIWSHLSLGSAWSARLEVANGQRLVSRGAFRYVRHPMYASLLLIAVALLLATANPAVALPFGIAILAMYLERVDAEEALMLAAFGEEYRTYMSRTGRLVPRLPGGARPFRRRSDS